MRQDFFSVGKIDNKPSFKRNKKMTWVEDSYISGEQKQDYISSSFNMGRLRIVLLIFIFAFGIIFFRMGYLQVVKGADYRQSAESNRIRLTDIKAARGIIYDRNGIMLAHNVPNFALSFTPADLPKNEADLDALQNKLAQILAIDKSDLKKIISEKPKNSYQSFILQDHIPYDKAIPLRIATSELSGVTFGTITFREYLTDSVFTSVLGYMGKVSDQDLKNHPDYAYDDYIGKSGIEQNYEAQLKGSNGKKEIEVDALGKEIRIISEMKPTSGQNLTLTIDKELQETLGQALDKTVNSSKNFLGGSAVAIDVKTGEILALISSPSFDNNKMNLGMSSEEYQTLSSNAKKPLFNHAISGEYPSGSTIKPVIASAALQEGVITPKTTVLSTGGIRINQWFFPDWKAGGHGLTDVRKALAESVNTFFYLAGGGDDTHQGLGVKRMTDYMRLFGLGDELGIDLPSEATGFLPSMEWKLKAKGEPWYIGDTYHLSIGQGDLLVTPLQVATYTATIANGGTFYLPHLLKSASDANGIITETKPQVIRNNFINEGNLQVVREGLRQGVTSGSSRALSSLPFTVAAKTGTAQFGDNQMHAWFTCFAPYENPQIAIAVLVEGGGEGNAVALPIAKEGLINWFSRHPAP